MTTPVSSFPALIQKMHSFVAWGIRRVMCREMTMGSLILCLPFFLHPPFIHSISPIPSSLAPSFSSLLALKFGICWRFSET